MASRNWRGSTASSEIRRRQPAGGSWAFANVSQVELEFGEHGCETTSQLD